MTEDLKELKKAKCLVSVRRENINSNRIQGFLLNYSNELVLLKYVYDFNIDGVMILRRSDITSIASDKTDIYQTKMLKEMGLSTKFDFKHDIDVANWEIALTGLSKLARFMIIEDENSEYPLFFLGEPTNIKKESIILKCFSGAGNWDSEPSEIYYEDISSVQSGNNYANTYEKYFEKKP